MTIKLISAFVLAFCFATAFGRFYIPWLRRQKAGQQIKEIGPTWHMNKSGTPTMGGVMFILARSLGKYLGARISSTAMGCDQNIRKYLGITLLPQAGVAIGMYNQAAALGGAESSVIRNVTLFAVLVYELTGPFMTREALTKAGEIVVKPAEKQSRNRFKAQGTGRA